MFKLIYEHFCHKVILDDRANVFNKYCSDTWNGTRKTFILKLMCIYSMESAIISFEKPLTYCYMLMVFHKRWPIFLHIFPLIQSSDDNKYGGHLLFLTRRVGLKKTATNSWKIINLFFGKTLQQILKLILRIYKRIKLLLNR